MLRIGTCSWKYPSWAGIVYSRAEGIDYLAEYARRYSTVEVDQWFWAMPDPQVAQSYAQSVPPTFRFAVKAFNGLTWAASPGRKGQEATPNLRFLTPELYGELLSRLAPLGKSLGLVMLQFEYLNRKKMAGLDAFLDRLGAFLAAIPRDIPIAVETRNANYLTDAYFALLEQRGAGHVFLQGYWMPPVTGVYERFRDRLAGTTVLRLHGPDRQGMEEKTAGSWDRIITPRDADLVGIAEMVGDMRRRGLDVYLNVNNHYEGCAPLTIDRLAALGVADDGAQASGAAPGSAT